MNRGPMGKVPPNNKPSSFYQTIVAITILEEGKILLMNPSIAPE